MFELRLTPVICLLPSVLFFRQIRLALVANCKKKRNMDKRMLPQEIILLVCQELGARREFTTLYHCSLVSRRVASIAVEQLYSILGIMDPFIEGKLQTAQLWRSIILSSLGATFYPYCAYIRSLSLGGLVEFLEDIRLHSVIRDFFFGGLMQDFLVMQGSNESIKATRFKYQLGPIDRRRITIECADCITKYIKGLADNNGTAVALTHLEASSFPRDILPTWIGRLGTLRSLQLQDGSVLGVEAARAIAESCPNFAELVCFHCSSGTAAEDLAAFFLALHPNSLQRFEVLSFNDLGEATLAALNTHSESLRVLHLRSLLPSAVNKLDLLSGCTALESLLIEYGRIDTTVFDTFGPAEITKVAAWISSCKALRELNFNHFGDVLPILRYVLQAPEIRLEQLVIQDYPSASEEITKATWGALGQQDRLQFLTIALQDSSLDGLVLEQHPELTDSICQLSNLTTLNLMQTYVSFTEIRRIAIALPHLEELSFGGDLVDDSILGYLSALSRLVSLSINAITAFKFANIQAFAQRLDPVGNSGITVDLLNQWYEAKLTEEEETWLNEYYAEKLNGRIAISYPNDPDDFHEGDFSDSD
ncbi:hypothetical protein HD806DRAFT_506208 [Xylariaceae sp. AK1471]|nr:hypothetical protein HD806DRAFT_506208 [Xylariaceae sp. AK1471]